MSKFLSTVHIVWKTAVRFPVVGEISSNIFENLGKNIQNLKIF